MLRTIDRVAFPSLRRMSPQEIWKAHFASFTVSSLDQFAEYVAWKRQLGVWGDDPEIQAMSEMYNRPVLVYAFHPVEGAVVLNRLAYAESDPRPPIRCVRVRVFACVYPLRMHVCAYVLCACVCACVRACSVGTWEGGVCARLDWSCGCCAHPPRARWLPFRLSFYGGGHYDSVVGLDFPGNLLRCPPAHGSSVHAVCVRLRGLPGLARHFAPIMWLAAATERTRACGAPPHL